jgi:hypothetical protein
LAALVACAGPRSTAGPTTTTAAPGPTDATATTAGPTTTAAGGTAGGTVLLAAGDIGDCTSSGDEATAALVGPRQGAVATLGDTVYERGTPAEFARCYAPNWGRFRDRTRPAPGNHDYATKGGAGYHAFFGAAAGKPGEGWYSYDLGGWHVIVLNSNCGDVPCQAGGAQHRWLRADLAAHASRCTLAYWHHPRWSSGLHGSTGAMGDLWSALVDGGADVVLSGHDHDYERFSPLDKDGRVDPERGIRSFVVGTGGRSYYPFSGTVPGSEKRIGNSFGILVLDLQPAAYRWEFVPVAGGDASDGGTGTCH